MATNNPGFIFNEEPNSPNSKVSAVNLNNLISKATIYNIGENAVKIEHIDSYVAGAGLSGGNGMPLSVQVDGKTLEISNDALKIKSLGVKTDNIEDKAITKGKLSADLQKLLDDFVKNALRNIYQVGDFFITRNATFNPADRFGGQWQLVKDRFLLGAGGDYELSTEGGEAEHTLTVEEMPKHTHKQPYSYGGEQTNTFNPDKGPCSANTRKGEYETGESGDGKPHNNMPPYVAVNIWVKISDTDVEE